MWGRTDLREGGSICESKVKLPKIAAFDASGYRLAWTLPGKEKLRLRLFSLERLGEISSFGSEGGCVRKVGRDFLLGPAVIEQGIMV